MEDLVGSGLIDLLIGPVGLLIGLILAVSGVLREWWVPGRTHRRLQAERDMWMELATRGLETADRAVRLVDPPVEG